MTRKFAWGGSIGAAVVLQTAYATCGLGVATMRNESRIPLVGGRLPFHEKKSVGCKPAMPNETLLRRHAYGVPVPGRAMFGRSLTTPHVV
jgi:hypothetical protein